MIYGRNKNALFKATEREINKEKENLILNKFNTATEKRYNEDTLYFY